MPNGRNADIIHGENVNQRTIFFVSDQTGVTAETLGYSLLTQFESIKFRHVTMPFISTPEKAEEAVRRINQIAKVEGTKPIVFSTLVQDDLRAIINAGDCLCLDFFDAFVAPLEKELKTRSSHTTGKAHGIKDVVAYTRRIEATNFALAADDGAHIREYKRAEVILIGVSRSGKTPTSLYLALQYGVFAANYPLTEEDFERGDLPDSLKACRQKLYGLTIDPDRLQQIRNERRPESNYSSTRQVQFEIREALGLYKRYGIPFIETTECSIEEIASTILNDTGVSRHMRP